MLLLLSSCSTAETTSSDVITVEGEVAARGNEPFVRYILETREGNLYALRLADDVREGFETPARLRATGRLYAADWQGRSFAHIDVTEWSRLD